MTAESLDEQALDRGALFAAFLNPPAPEPSAAADPPESAAADNAPTPYLNEPARKNQQFGDFLLNLTRQGGMR